MKQFKSILIIEDYPTQDSITTHLINHVPGGYLIDVCNDVQELGDKIAGPYNLPDFILLDINFQGTSGLNILRGFSNNPNLNDTKTIVLSAIDDPLSSLTCNQLNTNCLIVKHEQSGWKDQRLEWLLA